MTTPEQPPAAQKKKVGRSPGYPGVTISVALAKAAALYQQEGKYPAPMSQAIKAWGYSEKSSGGREIRAAMRYYGLIAIDGDNDSGMVKLTDDALAVILDTREDATEKNALVRKLALNPAIHKKLVAKYPMGLPSDGNVTHFLVITEGFNPGAAADLLAQFKITATFAGLFQPDNMKGNQAINVAEGETDLEDEQAADDPPADALKGRQPPLAAGQVKIMSGERIVFTEETNPQVYLKIIASGDFDATMLEALEDFVKRQKKRIKASADAASAAANHPLAQ